MIASRGMYIHNIAYIPSNWKDIRITDMNEIYRNSLCSFLYIGAAGSALDILRSLHELHISAGLQFRYAAPLGEM